MTKAEKRCEWLTDKYILCLLALFPLFTGFHGYANLTAAKFWLYTGVTALWALGIAACLCCAVALWQIAGGNPLGLYPNGWRFADAGTLYSGMYLGTVGNTLILGSVLSLAVPVLVYTAVKKRGGRSSFAAPRGNGALCPVPERMLIRVGRAAWLMRADAAEALAWAAEEVYSGGGGRFGADRAARGVFLSGPERDAV